MSPEPSITVSEPSENHQFTAPAEIPPSQPETPQDRLARLRETHGADPLEAGLRAAERGAGDGNSFTVPPAAGGADSFSDGPVTAFCILIGLPEGMLPDEKRAMWGRELRRIAALWSDQDEGKVVTASIMIWAFEQWQRANKDRSIDIPGNLGWKKPTPSYLFEHKKNDDRGFSADIGPLLCYGLEHGYIDFPSKDDGSGTSTTGNLAGMKALAQQEGWLDGDP